LAQSGGLLPIKKAAPSLKQNKENVPRNQQAMSKVEESLVRFTNDQAQPESTVVTNSGGGVMTTIAH
jgi:hypothetical protein